MPIIGSRATRAVVKRKGPVGPAQPPIQFVYAPPLRVGTAQVTIKTLGVPHVGLTVFADTPPGYPWYDAETRDSLAVNAAGEVTVSVTLRAVGDRIKAFASTGPDARDFTNAVESDGAQAAAGGGTAPTTGTGNAAAVLAKMGLGVNQERCTVEGHAEARTAAYYARYVAMGINWVRLYRPVGFESWQVHPNAANASTLSNWLDAAEAALAGGMAVVQIDGTDVIGDWQIENQAANASAIDGFVQRLGAAIAARPNLPASKVIVGACQEYGGTRGNAFWEPHRLRWNGYLRAALPNHTIVEGPSNWKDPRALFDPDFVPWDGEPAQGVFNKWSDANSLVDVHHYIGWDASGMDWLFGQVRSWSLANNRGVITGEYGFDDSTYSSAGNLARWIERMDAQTQYESVCLARPNLWAVTDGSEWPINEGGGNTMRAGMEDGIKRWAGRVNARIAAAVPTTPAQPTTPPPQGDGGTLNIAVRGQSNAYLFCEWGNGYPEGVRLMKERIQELTGRTVNLVYAFGTSGDNTIYGGTEFLTQWMSGTSAGDLENALLRFYRGAAAASKTAPFVEIWMHNESDQKNNPATATWVAAVRAEAEMARAALDLSAVQMLRYFVPIRYNYGDIASIRAGMDQLAADPTFNARVSMAAWSAKMTGDDYGNWIIPNGSHIGPQDASDIAETLAQELAALYPSGGTVSTGPTNPGDTTAPPPTGTTRSIAIAPKDPPGNSTGAYSGTLTVTGILRVTVAVQNDGNGNPAWGFASTKEYAVPASGQVPITATFTANGQFLQVFDTADPAFQSYGGSFYFA